VLEKCDPQNRHATYSILSNLLGHPSPIRLHFSMSPFRTLDGKPDLEREVVTSFCSEGHRDMLSLVTSLRETIGYGLDIQIRSWPDLIGNKLNERYRVLKQQGNDTVQGIKPSKTPNDTQRDTLLRKLASGEVMPPTLYSFISDQIKRQ
jgi:hypothetical protein